jgi:hypothetical protein
MIRVRVRVRDKNDNNGNDKINLTLTPTLPNPNSIPRDSERDVEAALNAILVGIIDDITSARDKMVPIRQLHAIRSQHPQLDIQQYLQKMSAG